MLTAGTGATHGPVSLASRPAEPGAGKVVSPLLLRLTLHTLHFTVLRLTPHSSLLTVHAIEH